MWTTDNDHAAENQIHTGRHRLDEVQPSIGSWAHYGLGAINENLPKFIVLGGPTRSDTRESIAADYLGPAHSGVPLKNDPANPLSFGTRNGSQTAREQRREFELIAALNQITARENPRDQALNARIKSYELAFRMQSSVPEAVQLNGETAETRSLYGIDEEGTRTAGQRFLVARRLVERGVRFVQVFPSAYGTGDSHRDLKKKPHTFVSNSRQTDFRVVIRSQKKRFTGRNGSGFLYGVRSDAGAGRAWWRSYRKRSSSQWVHDLDGWGRVKTGPYPWGDR